MALPLEGKLMLEFIVEYSDLVIIILAVWGITVVALLARISHHAHWIVSGLSDLRRTVNKHVSNQ